MTVTYDGSNVQITGPIQNAVLAYGMLMQGIALVTDFHQQQGKSLIEAAKKNGVIVPGLVQ